MEIKDHVGKKSKYCIKWLEVTEEHLMIQFIFSMLRTGAAIA
jgi:hypothetical protein